MHAHMDSFILEMISDITTINGCFNIDHYASTGQDKARQDKGNNYNQHNH